MGKKKIRIEKIVEERTRQVD